MTMQTIAIADADRMNLEQNKIIVIQPIRSISGMYWVEAQMTVRTERTGQLRPNAYRIVAFWVIYTTWGAHGLLDRKDTVSYSQQHSIHGVCLP